MQGKDKDEGGLMYQQLRKFINVIVSQLHLFDQAVIVLPMTLLNIHQAMSRGTPQSSSAMPTTRTNLY